MLPLDLVPALGLFYLPLFWVGPWAAEAEALGSWSGGRVLGTSLLGLLAYLPWGVLTFPLLPLSLGAPLGCIGVIVWGWRHHLAVTRTLALQARAA
jgi:hypothetical protein